MSIFRTVKKIHLQTICPTTEFHEMEPLAPMTFYYLSHPIVILFFFCNNLYTSVQKLYKNVNCGYTLDPEIHVGLNVACILIWDQNII